MTASPDLLWKCGNIAVHLAGALETPGTRRALVTRLLAAIPSAPRDFWLEHDPLGKPLLCSAAGASVPLGLSFSRHAGWLWAAVSTTRAIGIDATGPEDFSDPYPDTRVFAPGELEAAARLVPSLPETRALLWSIKEAAGKALGTGFNTTEPLEFRVESLAVADESPLVCRVETPHEVLDALAGMACGFRIAVAASIFQARSRNG